MGQLENQLLAREFWLLSAGKDSSLSAYKSTRSQILTRAYSHSPRDVPHFLSLSQAQHTFTQTHAHTHTIYSHTKRPHTLSHNTRPHHRHTLKACCFLAPTNWPCESHRHHCCPPALTHIPGFAPASWSGPVPYLSESHHLARPAPTEPFRVAFLEPYD